MSMKLGEFLGWAGAVTFVAGCGRAVNAPVSDLAAAATNVASRPTLEAQATKAQALAQAQPRVHESDQLSPTTVPTPDVIATSDAFVHTFVEQMPVIPFRHTDVIPGGGELKWPTIIWKNLNQANMTIDDQTWVALVSQDMQLPRQIALGYSGIEDTVDFRGDGSYVVGFKDNFGANLGILTSIYLEDGSSKNGVADWEGAKSQALLTLCLITGRTYQGYIAEAELRKIALVTFDASLSVHPDAVEHAYESQRMALVGAGPGLVNFPRNADLSMASASQP